MSNQAEPNAAEIEVGDSVTSIRRVERPTQPEVESELAVDELLVDTEIEVELPPDPPPARPSSVPPPPPLAALRAAARSSWPTPRVGSSTPPKFEAPGTTTPATSDSNVELLATRAELERVARRMRARDAYLVELERAFDVSNKQIETNRLRNAADIARLAGRVRGQAFRIAELEAELRQAIVALAAERGSTRPRDVPNQDDLQLIRGIGPRFESQLRAMGITTLQSVAHWTATDVARVAEQLSIQPARIERDAWIDQARALSSGPD
jgi:predicted flap endonuclease-1-like 5' DNA nuclease